MAEFVKVAKDYKRMCDSIQDCRNCPFKDIRDSAYMCRYALIMEPEKAEEVIMKWAKENPVMTNRDKFKEVFGIDPVLVDWWSIMGAAWLSKEYKEPDKNG